MRSLDDINTQLNAEALGMWHIVKDLQYKDWTLKIGGPAGDYYLQWKFVAECTTTGEVKDWTTRKYKLSVHMTEGELVQTAFMAALQAEEHECRENFKYQGIAPFNPHIALSALMAAAHHIEGRTS